MRLDETAWKEADVADNCIKTFLLIVFTISFSNGRAHDLYDEISICIIGSVMMMTRQMFKYHFEGFQVFINRQCIPLFWALQRQT